MSIKEFVISFILKRQVKNMLDKLKALTEGYKTYLTAAAGVLVALLGVLFGPIDVGPVHIPLIEWPDFWTILWNALMVTFLRSGVSTAAAK